jgi:hypothetical protein
VIGFGNHVTCHVTYALVDDFRHSGHDAFCLRSIEALALQALHEMVGIKVKVIPRNGGAETAARLKKEWLSQMRKDAKRHERNKERNGDV